MAPCTLEEFEASLEAEAPPQGLRPALQALWWQGRGDWARAHELAQAEPGVEGAWVHAHLHRVEGDHGNAASWYRRAARPPADGSLQAEWRAIARALLDG